jgi:hypothetical protein
MFPQYISSKQIPFTTNSLNADPFFIGHNGEPTPVATTAENTMTNDYVINGISPTMIDGPRTLMGLQLHKHNRFMLVTEKPLISHEVYGMRIYDVPIVKAAVTINAGSWNPFRGQQPLLTNVLPSPFINEGAEMAPELFSAVGARDYQRFCEAGNSALFDAVNFADWMTNIGVLGTVSEEQIFAYMRGGVCMNRLPKPDVLERYGINREIAMNVATYPSVAYLMSDLYLMTNQIFEGLGNRTLHTRRYNARAGFTNIHGNAYLQTVVRRERKHHGAAATINDVCDPNLRSAYYRLGGTGMAYRTSLNFYEENAALASSILTAIIKGSSYEERKMVMIKTTVGKSLKLVDETMTFDKIPMPSVKITAKDYYAALKGLPPQGEVDAADVPLEAIKIVTSSDVVVPYTNTDRPNAVNIQTHAMTRNPNVNSMGVYINPFVKSRRTQATIAVIGTTMEDYDQAVRVNVIKDEIATAHTSGRMGSIAILAPASFPIPSATRVTQMDAEVPPYVSDYPVRCISLFDHENGLELLARYYAIPVITPKKVTIKPFVFETPAIAMTSLSL